ncbi:MAG: uracil-DNA glycosylase, partial [Gammaproteobacteria bacterium]
MSDPKASRRLAYLEAMGIQAWSLRPLPAGEPPIGAPRGEALEAPAGASRPDDGATGLGWSELQAKVSGCTACELHGGRTQTVFGVGNRGAEWLVIGEAPGRDEDLQGEPFVGRAGQLLNAMLQAIGLRREQVYIANILKCRPPNNRDPKPEEVLCC